MRNCSSAWSRPLPARLDVLLGRPGASVPLGSPLWPICLARQDRLLVRLLLLVPGPSRWRSHHEPVESGMVSTRPAEYPSGLSLISPRFCIHCQSYIQVADSSGRYRPYAGHLRLRGLGTLRRCPHLRMRLEGSPDTSLDRDRLRCTGAVVGVIGEANPRRACLQATRAKAA